MLYTVNPVKYHKWKIPMFLGTFCNQEQSQEITKYTNLSKEPLYEEQTPTFFSAGVLGGLFRRVVRTS